MAASRGDAHRARSLLTYLAILALGGIALAVVLPIGNRITAAPRAPDLARVEGEAVDCLGANVAAVQSGIFIDLHVPSPAGGDQVGSKLGGGTIGRTTGRGTLTGTCASRTPRAGERFEFEAVFHRPADDDDDTPSVVTGTVLVGGDALDVVITAEESVVTNAAKPKPLDGSELVGRLFLGVAIVIVAARSIGYVFSRIRQPRVIGEIVAGILLGPSLLGLFWPSATQYLFPAEVTSVLKVLAQFGLIFFMFLIGLELDHKLIRGSGHAAVLISHVSIVVPFTLGVFASLVLYPLLGRGSFTGFALFMGASMAITAFPVLARILTDTGLHRTRLGALAITCAAVDDVTAWCILAVVVAVVQSTGADDAVRTAVLSVAFVGFMFFVVRRIAARLATVHESRGTLNPPVMAGLIVALLLSAWATEEIGIHAIFGAFMLGAIMPRSPRLVREVTERLEDVTVLFLLPIFFAVVGLSTRFGLLDRADLWLAVVGVIGIAIAGKWGGSMIAARAAGQTWRYSAGVGILMNTRGLTEIVILTIGRSLGVISPALFTMMVLMALVTTVMATPLLTIVYPRRLIDREYARVAAEERAGLGLGRDRRILVAVADARKSGPLIDLATGMRSRDGRQPVLVLAHVAPPRGREEVRANLGAYDAEAAVAAAGLAPLADELRARGFTAEVVATVDDDIGAELARLAVVHNADLVVAGAHQGYFGRNHLGGAVDELLEGAAGDVAILVDPPAGRDAMPAAPDARIAVWFRGLVRDLVALELAAAQARGRGTMLEVIEPVALPGEFPDLGLEVRRVTLATPTLPAALVALEGAAMVFVGRAGRGDGAIPHLRAGLIEAAPLPVVVVQGEQNSRYADTAVSHAPLATTAP